MATKCKDHPYEGGPGVCAPCLAERLAVIARLRNGAGAEEIGPAVVSVVFPGYVSPFRSRLNGPVVPPRLHRFYSTPPPGCDARRERRQSLLSFLFRRSRSDVVDQEVLERKRGKRSWLYSIFGAGRRSWKHPAVTADDPRKVAEFRPVDRGMSPVSGDESPASSSGYSSDSSTGWRRPEPTPVRRIPMSVDRRHCRARGGGGGMSASLSVCISPLVWVGPRREAEVRPFEQRHALGTCSKFAHRGSRKLVDTSRAY